MCVCRCLRCRNRPNKCHSVAVYGETTGGRGAQEPRPRALREVLRDATYEQYRAVPRSETRDRAERVPSIAEGERTRSAHEVQCVSSAVPMAVGLSYCHPVYQHIFYVSIC